MLKSPTSSQSIYLHSWSRRHPLWSCGGLVLWLTLVMYIYVDQAGVDLRGHWHDWRAAADPQWWANLSSQDYNGICDVNDIVYGNWMNDSSVSHWDDLIARYHYQPSANLDCKGYDGESTSDIPQSQDRAFGVALPLLLPARPECQIYGFDETAYITRLLRSPAGMFLVGDSLTDHHMQILLNLLHSSTGLVGATVTGDLKGRTIYLNKEHPRAAYFQSLAGVPKARLDLPLISFWRDVHLLSAQEKQTIFQNSGERYAEVETYTNTQDWYPLMLDVLSKSEEFVDDMAIQEPNILVLNTGAHWKRDALSLSKEFTEEDVLDGYRDMVKFIEDKVIATLYPLAAFWRTNPPGQIDCDLLEEFDNMRSDLTSPVSPEARSYNYHHFEEMNNHLRINSTAQRAEGAFSQQGTEGNPNPKFRLVDVWPMSTKRPEAHLNPVKGDCLHWCRPGVQDHWQALLWHMIIDESIYNDYYI